MVKLDEILPCARDPNKIGPEQHLLELSGVSKQEITQKASI